MNNKGKMNCSLPFLYIVAVSIIPLLEIGGKGSTINTLFKSLILAVFVIYYFVESGFKLHKNVMLLITVGLYLVSQVVAYATSGNVSIIYILTQTVMLVIIFGIFPIITTTRQDIIMGLWIYVIFDFVAIIYNFIKFFPRFINLSVITRIYYDMYSFFDNKNTFGMVLFIGLVILFLLLYLDTKHTKLIKTLIVLQLISICISMCRTALVCSIVYLVCNYLKNFSKNKIIILFIGIATVVALWNIPVIQNYLLYRLFRVDVGTYRDVIVEGSKMLFLQKPIAGYGEGGWSEFLKQVSNNEYSHNGFYSIVLTGGILYFVAYIAMCLFGMNLSRKIQKYDRNLGLQVLFFYVAFIIYSFFEAVILCGTSAANFSFCTVGLIVPIFLNNCEDMQ